MMDFDKLSNDELSYILNNMGKIKDIIEQRSYEQYNNEITPGTCLLSKDFDNYYLYHVTKVQNNSITAECISDQDDEEFELWNPIDDIISFEELLEGLGRNIFKVDASLFNDISSKIKEREILTEDIRAKIVEVYCTEKHMIKL